MGRVRPTRSSRTEPAVEPTNSEDLRAQVRNLTCFREIAELGLITRNTDLGGFFDRTVGLIRAALDPTGKGDVRLRIDDTLHDHAELPKGTIRHAKQVLVHGEPVGELLLVSPEPTTDEESELIDGAARELSLILDRIETVADRDELRHQLQHADRLATLGQLAAGVAHQLNEPLGNILGFAQLAKKIHYLPGQAAEDLERIIEASLDAREVIRKLLLFARQMPAEHTHVTLNRIVEESLWFFESRCQQQNIQLVRDLGSDHRTLHADSTQLRQVLINLVINAMQAMEKGGTLLVRTWLEKQEAILEISDTGVGMPEEIIEQIFVPFFTTKEVDQGTGLGLAIVHGIVRTHGGVIDVESVVGEGTTFRVRLPLDSDSEEKRG